MCVLVVTLTKKEVLLVCLHWYIFRSGNNFLSGIFLLLLFSLDSPLVVIH